MGKAKNRVSVDDLATHFPGVRHLRARVSPVTLEDYLNDATMYLRFCKQQGTRICKPETLLAWREHMVADSLLSPNTINRRLMAIKALVKASAQIERFDLTDALKFRAVEPVKRLALRHRLKRHTRVRLEPDDVRRMCTLPDPTTMMGLRDRALLNVAATTGCRISEMVSIDRDAVFAKANGCFVQVIGKGKTEPRLAPLSRQALGWVERWLSVRDDYLVTQPLFTAIEPGAMRPLGHRISTETARRRIKIYAAMAGLKYVKPHDLRRFVGTQLTERYGLRQAQLALGHASPDVTARFYVLDELQGGMTDGLY